MAARSAIAPCSRTTAAARAASGSFSEPDRSDAAKTRTLTCRPSRAGLLASTAMPVAPRGSGGRGVHYSRDGLAGREANGVAALEIARAQAVKGLDLDVAGKRLGEAHDGAAEQAIEEPGPV